MTALNLLPVGQLDGGHVTYAVFGRRGHRLTAWASYATVIALAVFSVKGGMWNWVVFAALLTLVIRIGHPPVVDGQNRWDWRAYSWRSSVCWFSPCRSCHSR
jgi:hypothetical protein